MKPSIKTRPRSERTREAILQAAIEQFGACGVSGARTEAIAAAAGVNKALLYHYFQSKSGLHKATLQSVMEGVLEETVAVLQSEGSAGERLLRWALQHFDRMIAHPEYRRLLQQEFVRLQSAASEFLPKLLKTSFSVVLKRVGTVMADGVRAGELCPMDPIQAAYSILGPNVFYFLSAPVMGLAASFDPLSQPSLRRRRAALVAFLSLALFVDRAHGAAVANRILADTPMPRPEIRSRRKRL
jgi:TetR/AcrR family transcriptional regulator